MDKHVNIEFDIYNIGLILWLKIIFCDVKYFFTLSVSTAGMNMLCTFWML